MTTTREYTKTITNIAKFDENVRALSTISANFVKWSSFGTTVTIELDSDFTTAQETELDSFVSGFVDFTTAETLKIYLDNDVFPFINGVINRFAAENIAMGITQAGKTGAVLGLFAKKYDVHLNSLPISLKDTFDTGSLYEAIDILDYLRANTSEFTGLDPYVTSARLLSMQNEIETFLGVTLTV